MAPDAIPHDRADAQIEIDTRRRWVQLSAFQRDILTTIAAFEADGRAPYGLAIKDVLGAEYDEQINHGRLYPNLDDLVADGLVTKGARDGRTNEYSLTTDGERVLEAGAERLAEVSE